MVKTLTTLLFIIFIQSIHAQKLGFSKVLENAPERITTFCVPNNDRNLQTLSNAGIPIKFSSSQWLFISATPLWIDESIKSGDLTDFYFENCPPSLMSDSARMHHFVDDIHAGNGGLNSSYTGAGVIIGFVDTGIDFNHPDFKEANGDTRVLRYWDQTMPDNASSPQPYNYGFVWDSSAINNLTCTSMDDSGHGSTVAGQAAGNGLANGQNKGMAPDSKIIMVETDFSRPNWTLTVADACDYIFKVADTLGMPCVINLSVGTYLGSHDGNDPAAFMIEQLLDEKPGRIVVSAAGNSRAQVHYHQQGNPTNDTNFVWFVNNPFGTATFGANTVYFDLWSDLSDATWDFALGINKNAPSYSFRGRTNFHGAQSSIGTTIYDTIWNNGNQLARMEVYTEVIGNNFHMQMIAYIDSVGLYYRFETTGSGKYDLWSGEWMNLNNMVLYPGVPPMSIFPDSIYYVTPDTSQTIVSSWNCSEKVISVGNMRNRQGHIDANYNQYINLATPVGMLSPNSSKGPNRHGVTKPDITAAGDVSLGTGPLWILTNPAWNTAIDSGGWHVRNGGTSMASPVVAGIGALYLERCKGATYQDYLDDIIATAFTDAYGGTVPNDYYGYGKIHGLNALLQVTPPATPTITADWSQTLTSSAANSYQWIYNGNPVIGDTNQSIIVAPPYGTYQVEVSNAQGCTAISAPFEVALGLLENHEIQIKAYPNPSTSIINIDTDEEILNTYLVDMNGKHIPLDAVNETSFNLQNIQKGDYILRVETNKGLYQSKIVRL